MVPAPSIVFGGTSDDAKPPKPAGISQPPGQGTTEQPIPAELMIAYPRYPQAHISVAAHSRRGSIERPPVLQWAARQIARPQCTICYISYGGAAGWVAFLLLLLFSVCAFAHPTDTSMVHAGTPTAQRRLRTQYITLAGSVVRANNAVGRLRYRS